MQVQMRLVNLLLILISLIKTKINQHIDNRQYKEIRDKLLQTLTPGNGR